MIEESTKHHWLRIGAIALITFIVAFLAFYIVMQIMINRLADPMYNIRKFEQSVAKQEQKILQNEEKLMDNPFEPRMRPMIVNLVRENNKYQVIIDLKPLDGDENGVNIDINENVLTVTGELEKEFHDNEKIIKFSQTYYLDEKLDIENMTKEKKGNKLIVTIPIED